MNQWGERYLPETVASMIKGTDDRILMTMDGVWRIAMSARIDEALRALSLLEDEAAKVQRPRIAGLRASLTKGPAGLREAARKVQETPARSPSSQIPVVA